MSTAAARTAIDTFRNAQLPTDEKADALKSLAADLPDNKAKEVARTLLFGLEPSRKVADVLYLLVICSLLIILLACAGVLIGIFAAPATSLGPADRLFTMVLPFILGLFVPSPVTKS
jgi:hypothetical protein